MTENHIIFQENPNRKINLHRYEEIKQECRTNSKRKFKQYARWCQVNVNEKYKIEVLFSNSSEIFEHDNTTYFIIYVKNTYLTQEIFLILSHPDFGKSQQA